MATKWAAGWNMPGYLPESEPAIFEDWSDALSYLVSEIDRWWDDAYATIVAEDGYKEAIEERLAIDSQFLPIHTDLHLATKNEALAGYLHEQNLVIWITQSEGDDDGS